VLRSMLPDRFSLRTGFVYDPTRKGSQQGDILVVDENEPGAYFFREGDFAIVSAKALVCVIEVKTGLSKTKFREAVDALYSFRKVGGNPSHPIIFIFAYEAPPFKQRTLASWYKASRVPDEINNYPWAIFALNRGIIILRSPGKSPSREEWGHLICDGMDSHGIKLKSLSLFLQMLRKVLLLHGNSFENPFDGLPIGDEDIPWSAPTLRFGAGVYVNKGT
jgi:hypothetical protein